MLRRMWMVLFAVMLLPYLGMQAAAAEETGSIRVTLQKEGEAVPGGTVTLHRVGQRVSEGYRIVEAFGGGIVREEDAMSPHLAQWLVELEGDAGITEAVDSDGSVEFSRLEEGLYLLVQTETDEDFQAIRPFLVTLPYEGQWNIQAYPKTQKIVTESPPTGQHPAPILGAMGMVVAGVGLVLCADGKRRK